jgi:hypothetical protein
MEWNEIRLQGSDSLALRASKKLRGEEMLLAQMGGVRLRLELDRIPLWRGDDVQVKQLVEDFAAYLYLPRLRDADVLIASVREGVLQADWQADTFAYAQSKNETGRYLGLVGGINTAVQAESGALVVKPDIAADQQRKDAEEARKRTESGDVLPGGSTAAGVTDPAGGTDGSGTNTPPTSFEPKAPEYRRFHGSVQLDPLRAGRDAGRIADEVVQHLTRLVGADVQVPIEIQARLLDGASEKTIRDVTENCRTLRFDTFGFEEE